MRRVRHGRPGLTLVVTAGGAQPHLLRATLESVRNQRTPSLEVLVVCLDRDARQVTLDAAGDDTRVRILTADSVPAARWLGLRKARGRRYVFAAPGDVYLPGAVETALATSADLGGAVLLRAAGDPLRVRDLEDAPELAGALRLGRLVLDRVDSWTCEDVDPDGVSSAARRLRGGFTMTAAAAYDDRRLAPAPPHSKRPDPLPFLVARASRDLATLDELDTGDLAAARAHFAACAVTALRPFLEHAEVADDSTWSVLSQHARDLLDAAAERLDVVAVVPRAMTRLAAEARREDLAGLVAARRFAGDDFPTTVVDGHVYADLGVSLEPADRLVGARESALRARARRLVVEGDRLVLEVLAGVLHLDQAGPPAVQAVLRAGDQLLPLDVEVHAATALDQWLAETDHDHDHGLLRLTLSVDELAAGTWTIDLTWGTAGLLRHGTVDELDHHGSAGRSTTTAGRFGVRLRESADGVHLLVGDPPTDRVPDVEAIEIGGSRLHVTVRDDADHVVLRSEGRSLDGDRQHGDVWALALVADVWGLGERPLPAGSYRLHVERDSARTSAVLAPELLDQLPLERRTADHRVRFLRDADDGLVVRLDPLLDEDETGPRAQRRLQEAYVAVDEPLDDRLVYFQSFTGQWANDHPLAIQQELVRRRPDLRVCWAVADSSATVPTGAEPVLLRSREWYDVLARAGHIVTNIELDRWFRRRPGQQILQTFHGYPSKTMGLGLWRSRGLLPSHLEQQLDHSSRTWNALLTPHPEMDRYYREEYAYDGRILALGYPRDDALVSPEAKAIRTDARHRLGIAPGRRAVLYAPTWRDDLATNFRAAEATHHLDVEQAAAALGDDYVLLLRGHRFHASGATTGSRVLDVTSYPDVNDLMLAADAAVLDYSSLRFDFALTGRPMIFLVPDLDTYESRTRGFLWDFGETAPGPWVRDTAGVVAQLRDLDALATRCAEPIAEFNARYNTLNDGHAAERVVEEFFADLPAVSGP